MRSLHSVQIVILCALMYSLATVSITAKNCLESGLNLPVFTSAAAGTVVCPHNDSAMTLAFVHLEGLQNILTFLVTETFLILLLALFFFLVRKGGSPQTSVQYGTSALPHSGVAIIHSFLAFLYGGKLQPKIPFSTLARI